MPKSPITTIRKRSHAEPKFLALRHRKPRLRRSNWLGALAEAGFSPIVAHRDDVELNGEGKAFVSGVRHSAGFSSPVAILNEPIVPSLIFHNAFKPRGKSAELLRRIIDAFPDAKVSWSPYFKRICQKCELERVLCEYETVSGRRIERPTSVIIGASNPSSIDRMRSSFALDSPILIKPTGGKNCNDIRLVSLHQLDLVNNILSENPDDEFLAQQVIESSYLFQGYRFDVRLHAMVWNFNPLEFSLYEQGVVRLAGVPPDSEDPLNVNAIFTGGIYRQRQGLHTRNATVSELLESLSKLGIQIDDFWDKANILVQHIFEAIAQDKIHRHIDLTSHFFLTGLDIIIEKRSDGFSLKLIEINDTPLMAGWGSNLNIHLRKFYRNWGQDLFKISNIQNEHLANNISNGAVPDN